MTAIDLSTLFKDAFRAHPAGVAIITAQGSRGPVGLTASSVASVSAEPPALVFSVTRSTGSAGAIMAAESVLVHLLDSRHAQIARDFAASDGKRFTAEQGWEFLPTGEPHLVGVRAALRCQIMETVRVGTSTLVVAEVLDVITGESAHPMIYRDRAFRVTGDEL